MADSKRNNFSVYLLAICLLLETVAFVCVTFIQFKWSRDLRTRFDESQALLGKLKKTCENRALGKDVETLLQMVGGRNGNDVDDVSVARVERSANTALLQHMMLDMLKAEEKILLAHCQNNSKLCVPGPKGDIGQKGDAGIPGNVGPPGVNGTDGAPGLQGPTGTPGVKGDQGAKGEPGATGQTGPQGPTGPKGELGLRGMKGDPGNPGSVGLKGDRGDKGDVGQKGQPGQAGLDGQKGEKGSAGTPGPKGEPGPQGPEGPPGIELQKDCICVKAPKVDIFPKTTTYHLGDKVSVSCVANGNPPPSVTWTKLTNDVCTPTVASPNLLFSSLQPSEVGTWKCEAKDQLGTATKQITITANVSNSVVCNFEQVSTCLWHNDNADQSEWTVKSRGTDTSGTGPDNDHTFGGPTGHYIYMEGSLGSSGDRANLISPELLPAPEACFTFWYNMYGYNMGNLSLFTKDCTGNMTRLVHLSGDKGMQWHEVVVYVPSQTSAHSFVLQAVKGDGVLSDIAVDDLEYYVGKCKSNLQLMGPKDVSITVNAGRQMVLPCRGTGNPTPRVTWSKTNGCGVLGNFTGSPYSVSHVTYGDAGTYVCTLTNGPGSSITKTFHVSVNGTGYVDKCDFEGLGGLCDYKQDTGDKTDWIPHSGQTQSLETGPNNDHTKGTSSGTYLYIEASSPAKQGDNAILRSHVMPANQSACFTFWYNMYGVDMGDLRVYVEDSCTHSRRLIFSKNGNQSIIWHQGRLSIDGSQVPRDYYILIEAEVGSSYHSDIAIDDLLVQFGQCTAADTECDFETDLCSWTQSATDDFGWIRHSGKTTSNGTGPNGDLAKTTMNGYYLYMEATNQRPGDKADLVSKLLPAGHQYCLQFALNMHGSTMGSLDIMIKPQGNTQFLFDHFTQITNNADWIVKKVTIPPQQHDFIIIIEGVRGSGDSGDLAIDDIKLHLGICTLPAPVGTLPPVAMDCHFEVDLCTWHQSTVDDFDWTRNSGTTLSVGTGPVGDHTTGYGHYIYIEGSSTNSGDTSDLVSTQLRSKTPFCLEFALSMYGTGMGSVNVYTQYSFYTYTKTLVRRFTQIGNVQSKVRQVAKRQVSRKTPSEEVSREEPSQNQGSRSSKIQGTNNRIIDIIHEGSGDYSGTAGPGREPMHVSDLTDDQVDIIQARLADHSRGTMTMSTQTDHVIIISSDDDMKNLIQGAKPKMVDKETSTHELEEMNLTKEIKSVEKKIEEKFDILARMLPEAKNAMPTEGFDRGQQIDSANENNEKENKKVIKELPEPKTEVPEENEVDKENEEYQNEKEAPVEQTANIIMIETPGQGEEQFYEDSTYSQEPTESQIAALSEIIPEENQDKGNVFESNQKDAGKIKDEHSKIENTDEKPLLQQILKLLQQSRGESDQDFKIASSTKNCKKSINFSVQQTQDNEETHQVPQVTEKEFEALATNISVPNELKLKYCMPNEATQVCHTINSANASIYTVNTPENSYVYIPNSSGSQEMDVNQSYDSVNSTTVTSPLTSTPATGNFLIEISGPDDMVNVPPHASVRISPELVQRTYATSHAFGPFGWSLVKEVYTKSERVGKSFNGNSTSKPPFSPRRKKALQLAIECMADRFELKDALIKNANECIVNGLRNEGRSRLVLSELTPKIHNKANM